MFNNLKIKPEHKQSYKFIKEKTKELLIKAISERIPNEKFGILFSGGIDSTLIALISKKLGKKFICYTAVLDEPGISKAEDLISAEKVAKELNLKLKIKKIRLNQVENYIKKLVKIIPNPDIVKIGVALPLFLACELAKKDNIKVVFSGLGSEEIFAGYERHRLAENINEECSKGLKNINERDLSRDNAIADYFKLKLQTPFLDEELIKYCIKIPAIYKLNKNQNKIIVRDIAQDLGLKKEFVQRKKRAAQYGSNFHKALKKLSKKAGLKLFEYLRKFYPKLGALVSSGKDSIYAMYLMIKQGYIVKCMITLKSKNPDSFMFHTPNVDLVKVQSRAIGIPLIEQTTKGEKEQELKDLKKALEIAKKKYEIDGVISGALYSNYQRERIEKIARELGLKVFNPLWHMDQEKEIREIIENGFEVIITSIAADGLNENWLGRVIDNKTVEDLKKLNKINIVGEGGEYESLVLNAPIFKKKIYIKRVKKTMFNKYTGKYIIESIELK